MIKGSYNKKCFILLFLLITTLFSAQDKVLVKSEKISNKDIFTVNFDEGNKFTKIELEAQRDIIEIKSVWIYYTDKSKKFYGLNYFICGKNGNKVIDLEAGKITDHVVIQCEAIGDGKKPKDIINIYGIK